MMLSKNFSRSEFACRCGCGFDTVDAELIEVLQSVRDYFDAPVTPESGCRCERHNIAVGGSQNSLHKIGRAADIKVAGVEPAEVQDYLETIMSAGGIGRYKTFTHVDTRSNGPARW